jgi:hypothetical protein
MEWYFRLAGEGVDVEDLVGLFETEAKIVRDDAGVSSLIIDLPTGPCGFELVRETAFALVAKLNGIARTIHPNHANVSIAGIACKDSPDTPPTQFIWGVGGIRSQSRMGIPTIVVAGTATEPPIRFGDRWLTIAESNECLERAVYLFGALALDWRGLYMVLDAAKDFAGDWDALKAKAWVPPKQIDDFKATCNSYKAVGIAARHGSTKTGIDKPRMTLPEAEEMVRTILEKWIKECP